MGRILIVDDNSRFRALAAELLAARGLEGAGAAAARGCPDGILLDLNLPEPERDGFAVAALLAAACAQARIVLTSAEVDYVPAEVMRTCAATAFVAKQELADADLRALFSC